MSELSARERIILAIDTSREQDAERLAAVAQEAGARFVKLGLELSSATSWQYCSDLAASHELDWVADAKLDDIPNTVAGAVKNIKALAHPPFGITMHIKAGIDAMKEAQEEAGDVMMFGVTELTSIPPQETQNRYNFSRSALVKRLAREAVEAGLKGIVASPQEVRAIKRGEATKGLFAMIPGARSVGAESHDQANAGTPAAVIKDGADFLIVGRQITQTEDPAQTYEQLVAEIEGAM